MSIVISLVFLNGFLTLHTLKQLLEHFILTIQDNERVIWQNSGSCQSYSNCEMRMFFCNIKGHYNF